MTESGQRLKKYLGQSELGEQPGAECRDLDGQFILASNSVPPVHGLSKEHASDREP
jgi:hypothetical protein